MSIDLIVFDDETENVLIAGEEQTPEVITEETGEPVIVITSAGLPGPAGADGPPGAPGEPGPVGNLDDDVPNLTILFENGLY